MTIEKMLGLMNSGGFFEFVFNGKRFGLGCLLKNGKPHGEYVDSDEKPLGAIQLEDGSEAFQHFNDTIDFEKRATLDGVPFAEAIGGIHDFVRIIT